MYTFVIQKCTFLYLLIISVLWFCLETAYSFVFITYRQGVVSKQGEPFFYLLVHSV